MVLYERRRNNQDISQSFLDCVFCVPMQLPSFFSSFLSSWVFLYRVHWVNHYLLSPCAYWNLVPGVDIAVEWTEQTKRPTLMRLIFCSLTGTLLLKKKIIPVANTLTIRRFHIKNWVLYFSGKPADLLGYHTWLGLCSDPNPFGWMPLDVASLTPLGWWISSPCLKCMHLNLFVTCNKFTEYPE